MKRFLICLPLLLWSPSALGQTLLQTDDNAVPMQEVLRYGSARVVAYTTGYSRNIAALTSGVKAVDLVCTTACHIVQGISPANATTNDPYVPANTIVRLKVGDMPSIAIIANATAGTAYVTELR